MKQKTFVLKILLLLFININSKAQQNELTHHYIKTVTSKINLLNDSDRINLPEISIITMRPKVNNFEYKIFKNVSENIIEEVEIKALDGSSWFRDGFESSYFNYKPYTFKYKVNGNMATKNYDEAVDLAQFNLVDMQSLFNYDLQNIIDSFTILNIQFSVYDDGTFEYYPKMSSVQINKNRLTYILLVNDPERGNVKTSIEYAKTGNGNIYVTNQTVEYIDYLSGVLVLKQNEESYEHLNKNFTTGSKLKGKGKQGYGQNVHYSTNGLPVKGKLIKKFTPAKNTVKKENTKSVNDIALASMPCDESSIIQLYNSVGQKINLVKQDNKLDKSKLSNGLYKIVKNCNGVLKVETIIINNN